MIPLCQPLALFSDIYLGWVCGQVVGVQWDGLITEGGTQKGKRSIGIALGSLGDVN